MGSVVANVKCSRLDVPIEVVTTRIDPLIEVVVHRLDESVVASAKRMDAPIFANSIRLDAPIEVTCSIIYDIGVSDYLIVEPNDCIWLTPDNNYEQQLSVYANVEWNID